MPTAEDARIPKWTLDGIPEATLPHEVVRHLLDTWDEDRVLTSPAVTVAQRWLWAIERVEQTRLAHGLLGVFTTCAPSIILIAIEAADEIGADSLAATLLSAGDIMFPDGWPTNEDEEQAAWDRLDAEWNRSDVSPFHELDGSVGRAQLQAARVAYVHSHAEAFFVDGPTPPAKDRLRWVKRSFDGDRTKRLDLERGERVVRRVIDDAEAQGDDALADAGRRHLDEIAQVVARQSAFQEQWARRHVR